MQSRKNKKNKRAANKAKAQARAAQKAASTPEAPKPAAAAAAPAAPVQPAPVEMTAPVKAAAPTETPAPKAESAAQAAAPIPAAEPRPDEGNKVFERRLARHYDELKWLYCELYHGDMQAFDYFIEMLRRAWADRKPALRAQDAAREADPNWYRRRDLLGMMMYTNAFAGTLKDLLTKVK